MTMLCRISEWTRSILPVALFALASRPAHLFAAAPQARERILFDADWRFQKGDPAGIGDQLSYSKIKDWLLPCGNEFLASDRQRKRPETEAPGTQVEYARPAFDDSGWRQLNLPHDWAIEGPFQQELPGETGKLPYFGVAWYRKHFDLPAADKGRQIYLNVDGAMSYASVWCNGQFVGGWPYGYSSWQLDLTPYLQFGGKNVLAIRLDNPNDSSRWYPGGGIYRHVWLEKAAPIHIAHWGTVVTTPKITQGAATVKVDIRVESTVDSPADIQLQTEIFRFVSKEGTTAQTPDARSEISKVSVSAAKNGLVTQNISLRNPQFWSLDSPNLYVARTSIVQNHQVIDTYETMFGVRTAEFTVDDGFHLNGKHVPIQGVCMHHDLGALGTAINTRALERQIEVLKEMGVNAIRTSHNPPAPELLDLCDHMGILVMDESFDCWKAAKKPHDYHLLFDDWSEIDLRAEVRRDRNHPSVVLWSVGNEIPEQGRPEGPSIEKELSRYVHEEDSTRPTTIAVSDVKGGYNGFQTGVDVFGYNYKPWEYGKFRAANPSIPIFGSETSSCISSRGEYFFPVSEKKNEGKSDFQVSSYDLYCPGWAALPDWEFKGLDENPFAAGEFVWTGFDYLGEPTPYGADTTNLLNYHTPEAKAKAEEELKALGKIKVPSRSSYFGIVDLAGFKKDRFYLYQSRWRPELPMAHILPHWTWPGREGEVTPVHVYTSGDEGELFLNGRSLGRQKKGKYDYRLRWNDVKYEPGELKVVTYKNGKSWAKDVVKTTGPAKELALSADRPTLRADGQDLAFTTIKVQDQNALLVPQANQLLHFEVSDSGEIVATDNGDATDHTPFQSVDRKAFNGLALVIVRAKPGTQGMITLRVSSEGLPTAVATLKCLP